ncbi:MAG: fibronectin type III domain-containing protein [Deltaproteobacteria bacterium]|nr:fibronectin type III domain-containing protein [Deltaproteobacteria bacterium]TLN03960.1 MAG: fibronectin type III domain-containing protein [bacterium]
MNKYCIWIGVVLLLAACGKRGPLVAPEALVPAAITDLQVEQKGNRFLVCWSRPGKEEWGGSLEDLAGFKVLRRDVLPPDQDCEECPNAYRQVKLIDPEYLQDVLQFGSRYCMFDSDLLINKTYQYKVVSFEKDGATSKGSNPARRTKLLPPKPPLLSAVKTPESVILHWKTPAEIPAESLAGFSVYRKEANEVMPLTPIARLTADSTSFADPAMEHGVLYFYAVRTLAEVGPDLVESDLSNLVEGKFSLSE